MVSKRYFLILFSVCLGLVLCGEAFAQRINTYTKTTFTSPSYSSIASTGTYLGGSCDDCAWSFQLPFAFKYDNQTIASGTWVYPTTNGRISFGNTYCTACYSGTFLGNANYYNNLLIMNADNWLNGSGNGLYWQTTGSAPNRVVNIDWVNFAGLGATNYTNVMIKLYENGGQIEFLYKDYNHNTGRTQQIGLNGSNVGGFIYVTHSNTTSTLPSTNLRWSSIPDRQISVQPEYVDFALADGGTVMTANITVSSVGTAPDPVLISNVVISTGHPDFTIISMPPSSLSPGQSATFQVQWTAQGSGPRGAVLLVQSNGRDSGDQQVALTGFTRSSVIEAKPDRLFAKKRVRLGEFTEEDVIIKNIGQAPLTFTDPNDFVITGEDAYMYTVVREPMDPLAPGAVDTLRIRFSPEIEGGHQASLRITNNSSNSPEVDILLKGTGVLPHIVVTPDPMVFDSVEIGTTATQKFTICNPGTDTLVLLRNEFTSADADFTIIPLSGDETKIAPEKCREVTVTFTPLQKGARVARYHVVTNIPFTFEQPRRDTATTVLYYDIQGTGVPVGNLSYDLTDDGLLDSSIINVKKCREVMITNDGDADATLNAISFTGAGASDYAVEGITFPYTLKAKSSVTVQVCGTPSEQGSRLATMTLSASSNEKAINLAASVDIKGLKVCADAVPTTAFDASIIMNNDMDSVMITVTNCGDVPSTYTPTITGPDAGQYSVTPTTAGPIPPQGTATFWVYFTPTSRGAKSATLNIAGDNVASMTVALAGQGACAVPAGAATAAPKTKTGLTNPVVFDVTVTNNGNLAWNVGTPTLTGDAAFAYVATGSDATIPANGSGIIKVSFHPSVAGIVTSELSFAGSGPCQENDLKITISGEGFVDAGVSDVRTAEGFVLGQNAPNPTLGSQTSFNYTVPTSTNVRIILTDVTGKMVRELVNGHVSSGTYEVNVNTTGLASGTYLYIMEAGKARLVRQMAVSK